MTEPREPPRLLDSIADERDRLAAALRAGRDELPSEAALEQLWSRLVPPLGGPPDGPAGGDGGSGASAAGLEAAASGAAMGASTAAKMTALKWLGLCTALGAAIGGSAYYASQPRSATMAAAPASSAVEPTPAAVSEGHSRPASAAPPVESASVAPSAHAASASPPSPELAAARADGAAQGGGAPIPSEVELLKQAQAALGADPGRALVLVQQAAQRYPGGALAQEREMIRIQALLGLGRSGQARAAAEAFRARHPSSPHCRRLETLFPDLESR